VPWPSKHLAGITGMRKLILPCQQCFECSRPSFIGCCTPVITAMSAVCAFVAPAVQGCKGCRWQYKPGRHAHGSYTMHASTTSTAYNGAAL
jgi:hypothetical protein